jgi:hypothetical protein
MIAGAHEAVAAAAQAFARVKGDVLVDVGVEEFTYAPVSDTLKGP